jgi:hypothetical protein
MPNLRYKSFGELIESGHALPPLRTAVVYPYEEIALSGAAAAAAGLIEPTLVGPEPRIRTLAASLRIDLSGMDVVDSPDGRTAAERAVELVGTGGAMGTPVDFIARSTYALNLFQAGGFGVVNNDGFADPADGAEGIIRAIGLG